MLYHRRCEITGLYVLIERHPARHRDIFRIRKIWFVDWCAHHGVIDCTRGLITCISLDIYQCLHILFQGIGILLWPRSCRVIIKFTDWLRCRYLHVSFCRFHWILQGRGGSFFLRWERLGLSYCLFVLLATFSPLVFEPNLWGETWVSVNMRTSHRFDKNFVSYLDFSRDKTDGWFCFCFWLFSKLRLTKKT